MPLLTRARSIERLVLFVLFNTRMFKRYNIPDCMLLSLIVEGGGRGTWERTGSGGLGEEERGRKVSGGLSLIVGGEGDVGADGNGGWGEEERGRRPVTSLCP